MTAATAPPAIRARALAAWMDGEARARLVRDRDRPPLPDPETALRDRGPVDQSGLLREPGPELAEHLAELQRSESAQRMFAEQWQPAIVSDLRRLIAAQPTVSSHREPHEPPDPAPDDLRAIAALALPLSPPPPQIDHLLDEPNQTWMVSSPNPNLRITGTFGGELSPGVMGFGFLFSVMASFVSVVQLGDRLILRDGYHRTHRLLAAGITEAPVFVRRYSAGERIFRMGMLAESVYLGDRPPTLADYFDDAVAADVWLPGGATRAQVRATPAGLAVGTIA